MSWLTLPINATCSRLPHNDLNSPSIHYHSSLCYKVRYCLTIHCKWKANWLFSYCDKTTFPSNKCQIDWHKPTICRCGENDNFESWCYMEVFPPLSFPPSSKKWCMSDCCSLAL